MISRSEKFRNIFFNTVNWFEEAKYASLLKEFISEIFFKFEKATDYKVSVLIKLIT